MKLKLNMSFIVAMLFLVFSIACNVFFALHKYERNKEKRELFENGCGAGACTL